MKREDIIANLENALPPGNPGRAEDLTLKCGQLFGWISGPDQQFLCNWLPDVAAEYPLKPMRIVEVGTFAGSTARGLISLSRGGTITCIDNFKDMNTASLAGHPDGTAYWNHILKGPPDLSAYAKLLVGDSGDIGRAWTEAVDLAFIDGAHDRESELRDIQLFAPHVVPGGYCLVDDYDLPDVVSACDAFFDDEWDMIHRPYVGDCPAPGSGYTGGKILVMRRRP